MTHREKLIFLNGIAMAVSWFSVPEDRAERMCRTVANALGLRNRDLLADVLADDTGLEIANTLDAGGLRGPEYYQARARR